MNPRWLSLAAALAAATALMVAKAAASPPSATTSTVDACIRVCPAGDLPLHVIVRDAQSLPVAGAVVTVDFCARPGVYFCPLAGGEPYSIVGGCQVVGGVGVTSIPIRAGGTSLIDPILVSANGVPLAVRAVVSSPDQNGDGVVDASDLALLVAKIQTGVYDPTGDFDCNGRLDASDIALLNAHMGHQCASGNTIETPEIRIHVVGPTPMRGNHATAFDLVIENRGSVVALGVPLWVAGVPADATVKLDFPLAYPPRDPGEPDWTSVPLTFTSAGGRYLPLVIPRIPPGTVSLRIYLTIPASDPTFTLTAALTPPWSDGGPLGGCLHGAGVISDPACMGRALVAFDGFLAATPGLQAVSGIGLWAKIGWECEGAATLSAALSRSEQVLDFLSQPVVQGTAPAGCEQASLPRWREVLPVSVVTAVDPNDKLGAHGTLSGGEALPYAIHFENLSTASAPAQDVIVSDVLDATKFEAGTVSLDAITFGSIRVSPPPGLSSYSTTVDLRPGKNLLVQVSGTLDPFTHALTWFFHSLDPATGQPPTNPLVGFLPPNITPPQGEGSVLFTVLPKSGLASGTQISNGAAITFDDPPALNTPPWVTSVDNTPPASHVLPFVTMQDPGRFKVQWTAEGSPPDLKDFTIYTSQDAGPYWGWRVNTTATQDTFAARAGHIYRFYSVARDQSGNVEAAPGSPDAQLASVVGVEAQGPSPLSLAGARPNPARGGLRVGFTLASDAPATLELCDLAGRRVARRAVGTLGIGEHEVALGSSGDLKPGLYFLRLTQGGRVLRARVAVIR